MEKPTHNYVITAPCGCVVGLIADTSEHRKDTAKEIASAIKDGCTVERMKRDTDEFRKAVESFGHHCLPAQPSLI